MLDVQFIDANDFRTEVELDRVVYFLHLMWNSEYQSWIMGIEDANQNVRLAGVRIVPKAPLLDLFHYLEIPEGEFIATGEVDRMSFVEGRGHLYYLTPEEYATI